MSTTNDSMRRGLLWLGSGVLVGRACDLASLGVVLWFVSDRALGEASLAWSVSTIVEAASGTGCGVATTVLQSKELSTRQLHAAFWFALGVALLAACLLMLGSPLLGWLYAAPRVVPFLSILALRHVAVGAASVPLQRLNHELRYRDVAAVQTLATVVAAVVRTGVAVVYGGAWALVIGHVTQALALVLFVFVVSGFRPARGYAFSDVRPMLPFGVRMVLSDLTSQIFRNVDYLLVGYFIGLGPLGLYRVAFDVAMEVTIPVADLVSRSVTPQLARLVPGSAELHDAFLYAVRTLGALMSPLLVVLFAIIPDVLALFGHARFAAAASTARVLVVAAALRVVYQLFRPLLLATGRASSVLRLELLALGALCSLLTASLALFGTKWGTMSAAFAWVAVYPVLLTIVLITVNRLEALRPARFAWALCVGFSGLPLFVLVASATTLLAPTSFGHLGRLAAIVGAVGAMQLWLKRSPIRAAASA